MTLALDLDEASVKVGDGWSDRRSGRPGGPDADATVGRSRADRRGVRRAGARCPLPAGDPGAGLRASLEASVTDDLRRLSLWWDTLPDDLRQPLGTPLPGDTTADVAIVGAGYTGLWTAYYLLRQDPTLRIVILEAEQAGFGASGRNGGWASALFPASLAALARQSGRDAAVRHEARDVRHRRRDRPGGGRRRAGTSTGRRAAPSSLLGRRCSCGPRGTRSRTCARGASAPRTTSFWTRRRRLGMSARPTSWAAPTPRTAPRSTPPGWCAAWPAPSSRPERVLHEQHGGRGHRAGNRAHGSWLGASGDRRPRDRGLHAHPARARPARWRPSTPSCWRPSRSPPTRGTRSGSVSARPSPTDATSSSTASARPTTGSPSAAEARRTTSARASLPSRIAIRRCTRRSGRCSPTCSLWSARPRSRTPGVVRWASRATGGRHAGSTAGPDWPGRAATSATASGTSNLGGRTLADLITGTDSDLTTLPWVDHRSKPWEPEPFRWIGANVGLRVMTSADDVEARTGRPSRRAALFARKIGH